MRSRNQRSICSCVPAAVALLAWAGAALANPATPDYYVVHVQPVDADFCDAHDITDCNQLVTHTEATGILEFDLFAHLTEYDWTQTIQGLSAEISWPEWWDFVEGQVCSGGEGAVERISSTTARLSGSWDECPIFNDAGLFLVGRVIMDVSFDGALEVFTFDAATACSPDGDFWPLWGRALAGAECSYCYVGCNWDVPCYSWMAPNLIELEAIGGEFVFAETYVEIWDDILIGCSVSEMDFGKTMDWMEMAVDILSGNRAKISLMATTAAMEPGIHTGYVTAEFPSEYGGCRTCAKVVLRVFDEQDVPIPSDDEPGGGTTWSDVKRHYR